MGDENILCTHGKDPTRYVTCKECDERKAEELQIQQTLAGDVEGMKEATVELPALGVRHLQIVFLFFCLTCSYIFRVNLSVAIVAMVDTTDTRFESMDWAESTQSIILSSFFWGYIVTQIPAGQLSERFDSKIMIIIAILLGSIIAILTPICASWGWEYLICLRVIQGLTQGFIHPCAHNLLSKWAPIHERGRLAAYCYSGAQFGTVIILAISGVLASSSIGWPGIFYFSGGGGLLWCALYSYYGSGSPATNKLITEEEKNYIMCSFERTAEGEVTKTPWKALFTSLPMISLIVVHCSHQWGFYTLLTEIPTYMKNIHHVDIKSNGLLSALPYATMWIVGIIFGWLSDRLITKRILKVEFSRKLFNSIGLWGPMCALFVLAFIEGAGIKISIMLLTLAVGINAGTYVGFQVNHIDLAPNHAGTMMGITNGAATLMSICAPLFVSLIVTDAKNILQWQIVFIIAAVFYLVGNLQYVIFGKAEVQSWNAPEKKGMNDNKTLSETGIYVINAPDKN